MEILSRDHLSHVTDSTTASNDVAETDSSEHETTEKVIDELHDGKHSLFTRDAVLNVCTRGDQSLLRVLCQ